MNRTRDRFHRAMTLMEVLAAIFVISIGLLGVLAVFPFGAHQVAKGRNAEHVANMLAAAGQDVQMMKLGNVKSWVIPTGSPNINYSIKSDANVADIYERDDDPSNLVERFDCRRFYMIDPFNTSQSDPFNSIAPVCFYKLGYNLDYREIWQEIMTGQDDLVYTLHDDKRTDFSGQGGTVASSGRYTWFMTFAPPNANNTTTDIRAGSTGGNGRTNVSELIQTVNVDLLGCYNRTPGDGASEREVEIVAASYTKTLNGAQITLQADQAEKLDLSKTKYIFVLWDAGATNDKFQFAGVWCKIAYAPKTADTVGGNFQKTIVVSGALPSSMHATSKAIIIDGVFFHKEEPSITLTLFD